MASEYLDSIGKDEKFDTAIEVVNLLNNVMASLQRSRTALVVPKKRTLEVRLCFEMSQGLLLSEAFRIISLRSFHSQYKLSVSTVPFMASLVGLSSNSGQQL